MGELIPVNKPERILTFLNPISKLDTRSLRLPDIIYMFLYTQFFYLDLVSTEIAYFFHQLSVLELLSQLLNL